MPATNSNTVLYASRLSRMPAVNLPNALAANTATLIASGDATYGSVVTDVLFRSASAAATNFDIIICATGSQATAENAVVMAQIPANSGNNGTTGIASLAALVPSLFDIDLAGNRVIGLEAGWSIYVRNTAITAGAIFIRTKVRDYAP